MFFFDDFRRVPRAARERPGASRSVPGASPEAPLRLPELPRGSPEALYLQMNLTPWRGGTQGPHGPIGSQGHPGAPWAQMGPWDLGTQRPWEGPGAQSGETRDPGHPS